MANAKMQAVIDHMNGCIRENRHGLGLDPYQVNGPASTSALKPDKTYTTVKLFHGQEIMLTGVRQAKKHNFVFEFAPVDSQTWKQVEFQDHNVFDFVQGLEEGLCKALTMGLDLKHKPEDMRFTEACNAFLRNVEKIKAAEEKARLERLAVEKKAADAVYEDNPVFGMF